MGYQTKVLVMWYKMSTLGVASVDFQYGSTATSYGADEPPGEGLEDPKSVNRGLQQE